MTHPGDGMRHRLRPVRPRAGSFHDVWEASCSCGWREILPTQEEAQGATNEHDMDDQVWLDRADAKVLAWRYSEPD